MSLNESIKKYLHKIGYSGKTGKTNFIPTALLLISIILIDNIFCYIKHNLKATVDSETRKLNIVLAIKDIDILVSGIVVILKFSARKNHIDTLLLLLDRQYSSYNNDLHETKKIELIRTTKSGQKNTVQIVKFATWFVYIVVNILPSVIAAVVMYNKGLQNTDFNVLPLPLAIYRSETFNNLVGYFSIYLLLTIFLFYEYAHGDIVVILLGTTPQKITTDMKLFCIDLERINNVLDKSSDCLKLKDYTNYLVRRHQDIQNSVKLLTRCLSMFMCTFNQTICCHLCIFLYCATEVNIKLIRLLACGCMLASFMILVLYCHTGQQLINAGDEIRRSLYSCAWTDKPTWFKKDLLLMMIMANVPLHINPFGLYVVDYQNVVKIANGAYSYFNLIRTVKKM